MLAAAVCIGPAALLFSNVHAQGSATAGWNVRPWPKTRPAPRLQLSGLDGRPWSLSAQKGQVVLLNFWASWCEPCRAEMPSLERLAGQYGREGLSVVAVNYREGEQRIRSFLQGTPLTLPILLDGDGAAARAWTPLVFPSTVVIGRDGRPVFTVVGEADWSGEEARRWITPLLAGATSPHRSSSASASR